MTATMERPKRALFYCGGCNTGFEVMLARCPICRRDSKKDRKVERKRRSQMRKSISKAKRLRIFERDGNVCLACGSVRKLTLDHVVPLSKGGSNRDDNLQTLCAGCNNSVKRGKSTDYRLGDQA